MPISIVVEKDQFQIFASPRRFPALTILVLVLQILLFNGVTALGVKCEEVFKYNMGGKSCFIQETRINTTHFVIALPDNQTQDHEMTTMRYDGNRDATYLPQKIYYQFPNLLEIYAYSCSLKIVSRDNFRNLRNLTMLDLHDNLIALISFDTFEDLISLKVLDLSKKFLIISHFISILIFFLVQVTTISNLWMGEHSNIWKISMRFVCVKMHAKPTMQLTRTKLKLWQRTSRRNADSPKLKQIKIGSRESYSTRLLTLSKSTESFVVFSFKLEKQFYSNQAHFVDNFQSWNKVFVFLEIAEV